MGEVRGAGVWEGAWGFHAFSRHTPLPVPLCVIQPESSPNPILLRLYGGFLM